MKLEKKNSFLNKIFLFIKAINFLDNTKFKNPVLLAIPVYLISRMFSGLLILNLIIKYVNI